VSALSLATTDTKLAASVDVFVVDVTEVDAPACAETLHWRLLTTHEVTTVEEAKEIVRWYRLRWTIEQVFRTVKSAAMQADESQVTEARRFVKLAVVALIAAVRIMQIVIGRDGKTGQVLADAMDPAHQPALTALNGKLEGRTEKLKNPHPQGSLAGSPGSWPGWAAGRDIPRAAINRLAPRPSLEASPALMGSSKAGLFVPKMYDSRRSPIEMSLRQAVVETFGVTCDDGDPNERSGTDPASYHVRPGGRPDHRRSRGGVDGSGPAPGFPAASCLRY